MSEASTALGTSTSLPGDRLWYRSLYWRIALGFIGFLAILLVVQSLLFIWLAGRNGGLFPAASNGRLADLTASDLRDEIERNPDVDLASHISREYGRVIQPFVVVLSDGRGFSNRTRVPAALMRTAQLVLTRLLAGGVPRGRRTGGPGGPAFSPIVIDGHLVGLVAVPPGPPPLMGALSELGPTMAVSGILLLLIGAGASAALIFGPVRQRLSHLQEAAAHIGAGDVTARAPEHGGDEVAALAHSFNQMAADLQARAEALTASDRARRQLLADVSHELMTPLTAMRGYLETLTMPEMQIDPAMRERYLRIVDEESRRLERIIGDLLDLARLEGGGATLRHEVVDVGALFERVATRHEREVAAHRISLLRRVEPGAERVTGDPDRLEQVLQNLAANALRHTPDEGEIRLSASLVGSSVLITIRDSGPGIAPQHLPLIFDRFYKVDAARRASGGSGLGLSIAKAIVEAHGGTMTARNDHGAVFEIRLPAASS